MINTLRRPVRIVIAAVFTALLVPCLGFGAFGLLASREPGPQGPFFMVLYAALMLGDLAVIGLVWWDALRTKRVDRDGICRGCGYELRNITELRCPECGLPI